MLSPTTSPNMQRLDPTPASGPTPPRPLPDGSRQSTTGTATLAYKRPGMQTQVVKDTLAGIRRTYARAGDRRTRRTAPLLTDDLHTLVAVGRRNANNWSTRARERRDSAIPLLSFVGAFRRSELAGLSVAAIETHEHYGLIVRVRVSKTDQIGEVQVKILPYRSSHLTCPMCLPPMA